MCRYTNLWNISVLKATIENKLTSLTTHFKSASASSKVYFYVYIRWLNMSVKLLLWNSKLLMRKLQKVLRGYFLPHHVHVRHIYKHRNPELARRFSNVTVSLSSRYPVKGEGPVQWRNIHYYNISHIDHKQEAWWLWWCTHHRHFCGREAEAERPHNRRWFVSKLPLPFAFSVPMKHMRCSLYI